MLRPNDELVAEYLVALMLQLCESLPADKTQDQRGASAGGLVVGMRNRSEHERSDAYIFLRYF
jgi:hypothetical protein